MKTLLLVLVALLSITSVYADHRCADGKTADQNKQFGTLGKALEAAKKAKVDAEAKKAAHQKTIDAGKPKVEEALKKLKEAQAAYKLTNDNVKDYHKDYETKSLAVAACKPDDVGTTCDLAKKNTLAMAMVVAGRLMIANDQQNKKNRTLVEALTKEYNQLNSDQAFKEATSLTDFKAHDLDIKEATDEVKRAQDKFDAQVSSGTDEQNNCMINQYNSDMSERARLTKLKTKCATACSQSDLVLAADQTAHPIPKKEEPKKEEPKKEEPKKDDPKKEDPKTPVTPAKPKVTFKSKWRDGTIRFPDCIPQGFKFGKECFTQYYKTYWLIEVFNVFTAIVGLFPCAAITEYDYGFCTSNVGYTMIDKAGRAVAKYAKK